MAWQRVHHDRFEEFTDKLHEFLGLTDTGAPRAAAAD